MEPLDDHERDLLRSWGAPRAPEALRHRVFATRRSRWSWLMTGTVRLPVPVLGVLALVLLAWLAAERGSPVPAPASDEGAVVSLADFRPVSEIKVRVVGEVQ